MTSGDTVFVSAGEFSGDILAAELVAALRHRFPSLHFAGVCGPSMRRANVTVLSDQAVRKSMHGTNLSPPYPSPLVSYTFV